MAILLRLFHLVYVRYDYDLQRDIGTLYSFLQHTIWCGYHSTLASIQDRRLFNLALVRCDYNLIIYSEIPAPFSLVRKTKLLLSRKSKRTRRSLAHSATIGVYGIEVHRYIYKYTVLLLHRRTIETHSARVPYFIQLLYIIMLCCY